MSKFSMFVETLFRKYLFLFIKLKKIFWEKTQFKRAFSQQKNIVLTTFFFVGKTLFLTTFSHGYAILIFFYFNVTFLFFLKSLVFFKKKLLFWNEY
jgi:hypothetical protein